MERCDVVNFSTNAVGGGLDWGALVAWLGGLSGNAIEWARWLTTIDQTRFVFLSSSASEVLRPPRIPLHGVEHARTYVCMS